MPQSKYPFVQLLTRDSGGEHFVQLTFENNNIRMSVQGHNYAYSNPRDIVSPEEYSSFEVALLKGGMSLKEALSEGSSKYLSDDELGDFSELYKQSEPGIYSYMPLVAVQALYDYMVRFTESNLDNDCVDDDAFTQLDSDGI